MRISRSHTTPQFEEDFISLSKPIQKKAHRRITLFEKECFLPILDIHKLKGKLVKFWSFAIDDDHRVIFRFLPNREVIYYRIGPHRIYRELENLF